MTEAALQVSLERLKESKSFWLFPLRAPKPGVFLPSLFTRQAQCSYGTAAIGREGFSCSLGMQSPSNNILVQLLRFRKIFSPGDPHTLPTALERPGWVRTPGPPEAGILQSKLSSWGRKPRSNNFILKSRTILGFFLKGFIRGDTNWGLLIPF